MRPEEKERLHTDDAFVRGVSALGRSAAARWKVMTVAILAVGTVLGVWAVTAWMAEATTEARLNAVDAAESIHEMEEAGEAHPDAFDLSLKLGGAYARRGEPGDISKSETAFGSALETARNGLDEAVAAVALGKAKMDLEKFDEALKLFDRAADLEEGRGLVTNEAHWHAGLCLEKLGRPDEARDRYSRIGLGGGGEGTWLSLAQYRRTQMRREMSD